MEMSKKTLVRFWGSSAILLQFCALLRKQLIQILVVVIWEAKKFYYNTNVKRFSLRLVLSCVERSGLFVLVVHFNDLFSSALFGLGRF